MDSLAIETTYAMGEMRLAEPLYRAGTVPTQVRRDSCVGIQVDALEATELEEICLPDRRFQGLSPCQWSMSAAKFSADFLDLMIFVKAAESALWGTNLHHSIPPTVPLVYDDICAAAIGSVLIHGSMMLRKRLKVLGLPRAIFWTRHHLWGIAVGLREPRSIHNYRVSAKSRVSSSPCYTLTRHGRSDASLAKSNRVRRRRN